MKKLKKTVSILLSLLIVISLFSVVPITAFAAEGTYDIDDDGNMTLHAGIFTNPDFSEFDYDHSIKTVFAEPGVVFDGDCAGAFYNLQECTSIDISKVDMSDVTSVSGMFSQCYQCETITLPKSNVCLGTSTVEMFYNCNALKELDLSGCDTSDVLNMSKMFSHCRSIKSLDLKGFDTSSVKNMQEMFYECSALETVDLSSFDTKKVTNMYSMFSDCPGIKTLDLSSFDTSKVGSFDYMFCNSVDGRPYELHTIYVSDKWDVEGAGGANMFLRCFQLVGGQGTRYSYSELYPEYSGIQRAHIDGGQDDPGYLTKRDKVTVKWKNYDGSVLKTESLDRGSTASYTGETPVKPDTAEYTYTFSGWEPEPGTVNQDTEYTAQFTEAKREYTITWKNDDGTVIDTTSVAYGDIPYHVAAEKPTDGNTVYTFTGWVPEPTEVTGDAEYTASFTSNEYNDWGVLQAEIDSANSYTFKIIKLEKNYTADDNDPALIVPQDKIIKIELNGHTIDRGLTNKTAVSNGNIITNYGSLTIAGTGTLKGGNNSANGGAIVNNGTLNISGGTVIGNKSSLDGGAVYNSETVNITGGSLYGNSATKSGGAISAHSGTINMSGGEIRNNQAKSNGGGIYLGVNKENSSIKAELNLTGGSIIYNRATNNTSQGGGILVQGTLNISGDPVVTDNTCGKADNVYLRPNRKINITGTLEETASLGVTIEGGNGGVITSGLENKGSVYSFISDSKNLHVTLNSDNEAELVKNSSQGVFKGKSLTLNGNIAVNFFIDPTPTGVSIGDIQAGSKDITVNFSWSTTPAPLTDMSKFNTTINSENFDTYYDEEYGCFKVSCDIAAAEMSCNIKVSAVVNNIITNNIYSVREYGKTVLKPYSEFSVNYRLENGVEKYDQLVDLVTKMLDYGAKAQKVFNINTGDLANSIITDYSMDKNVTKDMCTAAVEAETANAGKETSNMATAAAQFNAEYYSTSLIYLSKCTLRHYFTFEADPGAYEDVQNYLNDSKAPYYYIDKADIPAAELDKLQAFNIGENTYYYSALDFAGAMIQSAKATDDSKSLAMALYWYNQAANEFFE